jgi:integrase/recombinase XerD
MATSPMVTIVEDFLSDLARAGKSAHTVRAYRSDLRDFSRFFTGPIERITTGVLRAYLGGLAGKAPATRARREATLASLLTWAYRAEMIAADPMTRLDRTRLPASPPRPVPTEQVEAVLRVIPKTRDRDRLLFLLLYTTGIRVGEALAIEIDDLDLNRDDEHVTILGKGGRRRPVLLDDPVLVTLLRRYLKVRGYRHGPLFRAEKNYAGGPLRYASAQQLWAKYREKAQIRATIHQLRHVHATELVNAGVALETIRRRLGHANAQTVLRYADQRDTTTDAEIRSWRRRKITGRPNS